MERKMSKELLKWKRDKKEAINNIWSKASRKNIYNIIIWKRELQKCSIYKF